MPGIVRLLDKSGRAGSMSSVVPIRTLPNIPTVQQFTQRLVDQFNRDESKWRKLQEKLHGVAERFKQVGRKRRKRTSRRIIGFNMTVRTGRDADTRKDP
jgi:hypothetical protein